MKNILFLVALLFNSSTQSAVAGQSESQIKQLIINQSISSYPGNCPCPYNSARNGSQCGRRSAYSRAGGYAPLCYPDDVTNEMVAEYKRQHPRD